MLKQQTTRWAWQFFWLQSAVLCVYVLLQRVDALGALAGSVSYLSVQFLFIRQMFRQNGAQHSRFIVSAFYQAEAIKLLFFAFLCYLCLQYLSINPMIFLGAVLVAQSVSFWGPFLLNQRSRYSYE